MAEIPLSQGKVALVDDADFDFLNQWKWSASRQYCAARKSPIYYAIRIATVAPKKRIHISMHRLILGLPRRVPEVDHCNGEGLDNRRANLRIATRSQNAFNRTRLSRLNKSGVTGVHWYKKDQRWRARVKVKGKIVWTGLFRNKDDAIRARNLKAHQHFGQFAPQLFNLPQSSGGP